MSREISFADPFADTKPFGVVFFIFFIVNVCVAEKKNNIIMKVMMLGPNDECFIKTQ